ncbi:hypothetical protein FGRMN_7919 [Fusarium graminum]|nr:hypothetical protein FGRMN_7919 [Fusarium graminum]
MTTIVANKVPKLNVKVTQTKAWASLSPATIDSSAVVAHHNMDIMAGMSQTIIALLVEVTKSLGDINKKLNKQSSDIGNLKEVLGIEGSANTSRRSSIGSAGRRSSVGESSIDEPEVSPFDDIMTKLRFLDEFLESFVQDSTHKPLSKRSKNLEKSGDDFVEAARQSLAGVLGDDSAEIFNAALDKLGGPEVCDIYIALSKRLRHFVRV